MRVVLVTFFGFAVSGGESGVNALSTVIVMFEDKAGISLRCLVQHFERVIYRANVKKKT